MRHCCITWLFIILFSEAESLLHVHGVRDLLNAGTCRAGRTSRPSEELSGN